MFRKAFSVFAAATLAGGAHAATYDISGDFGGTMSAYGSGTVGSSFNAYTQHVTCNPNLDCYPDGAPGNVVRNNGTTTFANGTVRIPAGSVFFHPQGAPTAPMRSSAS